MRTLMFASSCLLSVSASSVFAAEAATQVNVGDSLGRLVLGTLVVLLVIGGLAWLARRYLPGQVGNQVGVIHQVGGLQLSPRERVVVLEVAGRWLVVGCHGGQMTALGDLAAPTAAQAPFADTAPVATPIVQPPVDQAAIDPNASFAKRLQQAMQHTLKQTLK